MEIVRYDKHRWDLVSEEIHFYVFEEHRSRDLNRIDFALVAWSDDIPVGYLTCRETDSESVYISHGGVLPDSRLTEDSKAAFSGILDFLKKNYKRANMLVENTNVKMLKKALNEKFIPVGITNYCGSTFVDLRSEF